jgi:hypothetical protein
VQAIDENKTKELTSSRCRQRDRRDPIRLIYVFNLARSSADADVDKRAEGGDVGHHAFEDHTRLEVGARFDALFKHRGFELRAQIAAGPFQLGENILHRWQAETKETKGSNLYLCRKLSSISDKASLTLLSSCALSRHRFLSRLTVV